MTIRNAPSKIENYLARTRIALRGLPEREIEDILRELRSHATEIAEQQGDDVDAALQSLGDPTRLAKTYLAENQMTRAECSRSPLVILLGLRHATRTRWGRVTTTALYAFGYINILALWSVAIEKLFAPSQVGLWFTPGNLWSLTLVKGGNPPPGAHELLGWWLVPILFITGWVLRRVVDKIAQWWIGRHRRANAPQES